MLDPSSQFKKAVKLSRLEAVYGKDELCYACPDELVQFILRNITNSCLLLTVGLSCINVHALYADETCLDDRGRLSSGETKRDLDALAPSNEVTVDRMKEKCMEFEVLSKSNELNIDARGSSLPSGISVPSIPVSAATPQMLLQAQDNLV